MKTKFQIVIPILGVLTLLGGSSPAGEEKLPFRTAFPLNVLNNADPRDTKVAAHYLIKQIAEGEGLVYSTEIPETNEDFIADLEDDKYDFFLMFSFDYLLLKERIPMKPLLVGQHSEEVLEKFVFLTKAEDVDAIKAIKNGHLLIQKGSGKLSEIWLSEMLNQKELGEPGDYFETTETVENVSKAVLPVFFGKADGCIVQSGSFDTICELNPQIGKMLKAHFISEPMLMSLLSLRAGYVESSPGHTVKVSTNLHNYPGGEQILTLMRVKKILEFKEEYIKNTRDLVASWQERKAAAEGKVVLAEGTPTPEVK
jgi:hypothetical protein